MNSQKKDNMHPEDLRNLFIFCVLSIVLYFAFDHFIQRPHMEAIKLAQQQQALQNTGPAVQAGAPVQAEIKPRPRTEVLAASARVPIDNGKIKGSINLEGGRLDDISLTEYFTALDKKENVVVLSPRETEFPRSVEQGWISTDTALKLPNAATIWRAAEGQVLTPQTPVTLEWDNGAGLIFSRRFAVDDQFMITITESVRNQTAAPVTLSAYGLVTQAGLPADFVANWLLHEGPIGYIGEELHEVAYSTLRKEGSARFDGTRGWTGVTDKYWLIGLIPAQGQNISYGYHYTGTPPVGKAKDHGLFQTDFTAPAITIAPGATAENTSHVFAGAKQVLVLEQYEASHSIPHFNLAVNFGWFWFFSKPFFYALHYLALYAGNMGVAIILLTILVRSSVFPLTNASYKSFAKMKKVGPQVAEMRKLYGTDKKRLQEELLKLYQSEGVNPMAGCFPILLQIPIFFALYKVLYVTIEMRHAPFYGWIKDLSASDPTNIFNLFGLIDWTPPVFLHVGIWPCLMLIAMIIQKKLNPPPQDPIQRDMANYFPFMIAYIMAKFPAGLVIYWTFSAVIGIIQQTIIMRAMGVPIHLFGQSEDEKKIEESVADGPAVHPLVDMAEREIQDSLFPEDAPRNISAPKPKKKKKKK